MVSMLNSVLNCRSSRVPLICLLHWFPVHQRVRASTCLFHQSLNVCYLGVRRFHPCRIDCRCRSPQMWIFHKLANWFLMFCDGFFADHMRTSFWSLSTNFVVGKNLSSSFSNSLFRKTTHSIYFHFPIFIY
jgi:hypothetical protein